MMRFVTIAIALCSAAAFQAPRKPVAGTQLKMARPGMSESVPFLPSPEPLDGTLAGDVDFDPMGLSSLDFDFASLVVPKWFNDDRAGISTLYWMREAELKHARICMLATLGWVAVDLGLRFPGADYAGLSSLQAHDAMVAKGNMGFMLSVIFVIELLSGAAIYEAAKGSGRAPGDFGFDPLGLGLDEKKKEKYAMNEIKNGRLAMLAFSGIVTQAALTGHGFPYV